tara:strand:+ start:754 stop:1218 length:465 start_codon:yes stop_codon:yes gene_type:complete
MPSVSKQQQKFFGVVKSMQQGDTPKKGKAGKAAKSMTKKDVDDFASTKHKGLPKKVKREMKIRELIRKLVREIMSEGKLTEAKETIFDVAARVMKDKQHQNYKSKKGKVMVDMQSANLLIQVSKKAKPQVIKFLSDLGHKNPNQLMRTLWALVK